MKVVQVIGALFCLSMQWVCGYAIYHAEESAVPEVDIFVFTDKKYFDRMLEKQGASEDVIKKIGEVAPKLGKGAAQAAEIAGYEDVKPALIAGGKALGRATRYAHGPSKWILEQKYSVALHKKVPRGNKGKGAAWNWKDIKQEKGISPDDKQGLYVVFKDPQSKQILWATHMSTRAGLGFKAVETGDLLVGQKAPFEKRVALTKWQAQDPSYAAATYHYLQRAYKDPYKLWSDIKKKFTSAKQKVQSDASLLEQVKKSLGETKDSFAQMSVPDKQDVIQFFYRELSGLKDIAETEKNRSLLQVIKKDIQTLVRMYDDVVVQTGKEYRAQRPAEPEDELEMPSDALRLTYQQLPIEPKRQKQSYSAEQRQQLRALKREHQLTQKIREGFNSGRSIARGTNPSALQRLQEQVQAAQQVVLDAIERDDAPSIYKRYMGQLNRTQQFLKQQVSKMHRIYHTAYDQGVDTALQGVSQLKQTMQDQALQEHKDTVLAIYGQLVEKIAAETPAPETWVARLPRLAKNTLSDVSKNVLKAYKAHMKAAGEPSAQHVKQMLAQTRAGSTAQVRTLLDDLQQYVYIQKKSKIFGSKTSRKAAESLLHALRMLYPDLLTLKDAQQIDNSLDVPTSILLTYAQGLAMVINDLSTELLELEARLQQER